MEIIASILYVAALITEFGVYTFPVEEIVFEVRKYRKIIKSLIEKKADINITKRFL